MLTPIDQSILTHLTMMLSLALGTNDFKNHPLVQAYNFWDDTTFRNYTLAFFGGLFGFAAGMIVYQNLDILGVVEMINTY